MKIPGVAVLIGCSLCGIAGAADWPEFRGPGGQGHAAGKLPTEWGPDKNVRWKVAVPGEGWSSPVVHAGRIYLNTAVPSDDVGGDFSLRAICLDGADGRTLWESEVFSQDGDTSPGIHTKNSHASPTPIVHDGHLYVHFGHQGTACLDLDGKVIWQNRELKYPPVHGGGGSLAVAGDLLIFSTDGAKEQKVNALNCRTGEIVWQTRRDVERPKKFAFSTPLVIDVDGRAQVVSPGAGMVGGYDAATGKEIWRVDYDGYSVIPRPVFGHGLVFISTGFDLPKVLAIRPDGTGNVTETHVAWELKRGAPHSPSLLLVDDELYMISDGGVAKCVDAKTGQTHWQQRLGGGYSASPLYADGKIYFQSEEGVGVVIAAGKQFKELARNDLKERTLASYAVFDEALLIRSDKHLYLIEAAQ